MTAHAFAAPVYGTKEVGLTPTPFDNLPVTTTTTTTTEGINKLFFLSVTYIHANIIHVQNDPQRLT